MLLKNCWYVAAWDHELIDGRMLARTILEEAVPKMAPKFFDLNRATLPGAQPAKQPA